MFKSKHSGWTWDLKRTPFGGGGGWNPVAAITDPISSALGTDGNGNGLLGGLADVDKFVGNEIPGGWALPAAVAAAGVTGYIDPSLFASQAATTAGAGTIATEAGQTAFFNALAAGATSSEAVSAGIAADAALTGAAGAGALANSTTGLGSLTDPSLTTQIGAPASSSGTFGSLNPALPGMGAPAGTSIGVSAGLAPGTILGTGLEGGGAIGSSYAAGANGLPATDFFGNYIPASSVNFGGVPDTIAGTNYNFDTLKQANQIRQGVGAANSLSKLLSQGAASSLSSSLGQLAQGANPQGQALSPWVHGNQNPFVMTQNLPIQNAPKLDLASLASLLKQG